MLPLKRYQSQSLDAVDLFLTECRQQETRAAWNVAMSALQTEQRPYYSEVFGETPSFCLRIPTGGGKTLLGSHLIVRASKSFLYTDAPVVVWLVPSDMIRSQTLLSLKDFGHPNRQVLEDAFPGRVRVCTLEELELVGPHEVGRAAIVVVATIQAFRIKDKSLREVYAFNERFAAHFQSLTPAQFNGMDVVQESDLKRQPYLTRADLGRPKMSTVNWLGLQRPLLVVDEAHNVQSTASFEALAALNPSAVAELTATPVPKTNVLYHVSAFELNAEKMIKLPVVLKEHPDGWETALRDGLLTRTWLESVAQRESDYVRPIVLIQAEDKNGAANWQAVLAYLLDEKLPREQIAVVTGTERELDGVDLLSPDCRVRFIITVDALKEGWDCSFAYVLCGLQEVHSPKDAEQIIGRLLRMPYANDRKEPSLTRAYAHIVAKSFSEAANYLADRLVQNMGFDPLEAATAIVQPGQQELLGTIQSNSGASRKVTCALRLLPQMTIDRSQPALQEVEFRASNLGTVAIITGSISEEIEIALLANQTEEVQEDLRQQISQYRQIELATSSPASRGIPFMSIPQLGLFDDGLFTLAEDETLQGLGNFRLSRDPVEIEFEAAEIESTFEIGLDDTSRIRIKHQGDVQLVLNSVPSSATEQDLVRWLDRELHNTSISQPEMQAFLVMAVRHLIMTKHLTLTSLLRSKFRLARALRREIERRRQLAIGQGFQIALPLLKVESTKSNVSNSFRFEPGLYPARPPYYSGRYIFNRHYYPVIHDLRERVGSGEFSEEFLCAQAIDRHPAVRHWVRNVERDRLRSFWLPTSTDYFYPDFVAELLDSRIMVVEYKGAHLLNSTDTPEKRQVGNQWEASSLGKCIFLMATKADDLGRTVSEQVAHKIQVVKDST